MRKTKNIILFLLILLTMSSTVLGAYDTFESMDTREPDSAADNAWAYTPVTGTRYVFRVNGKDIGGSESYNFYINHVRNTNNLTHYNPKESEESEGKNNKRNYEMVYVGSNSNNTVVFKGTKNNYYFFDEPSSSLQSYYGTYRHIIVWARRNNGGNVYIDENANFGLDKEDVLKLVGALEARINALKNTGKDVSVAESELAAIKNGAKYEIRAEVLKVMRLPKYSGSGTIVEKDVYAQYSEGIRQYYTYREAWYIQANIKNYAYGPLRDFFKPAAMQLRENDDDYVEEYSSEAKNFEQKIKEIGSDWWRYAESYYYGWDYMEFENPYEYPPNTVTELAQSETSGKLLAQRDMVTLESGESRVFWNFSGEEVALFGKNYKYMGMTATANGETFKPEEGEGTEVKVAKVNRTENDDVQTTISGDGRGYSVTYWYKQQADVKVIGVPAEVDGNNVKTMPGEFLYTSSAGLLDIPIKNKTISSQDDFEDYDCYQILGNKIITGTHTYLGEEINLSDLNTSNKKQATLNIEETASSPSQILVVFYYKPLYTVNVNHVYVDPYNPSDTSKHQNITTSQKTVISLKKLNEISSVSWSWPKTNSKACINYDVKLVSVDRKTGVKSSAVFASNGLASAKWTTNEYKVGFNAEKYDYELTFYYTHQYVNIKHMLLTEPTPTQIGSTEQKKLPDTVNKKNDSSLHYKYYKLEDGTEGTATSVDIPIKQGQPSRTIEFYYKREIPPTGDGYGRPVVCYPSIKIKNDAGNWVNLTKDASGKSQLFLESEFKIIIPDNGEHVFANNSGIVTPDETDDWNSYYARKKYVKFPFDVYYGNTLYNANTAICLVERTSFGDKKSLKSEFIFTLPVWVTDATEYEIELWVEPNSTIDSSLDNEEYNEFTETKGGNATNTLNVKVVGKIYDFTVTSLLSNSEWKSMLSLPTENLDEEYKAPKLPIGQESQRTRTSWLSGIPKGSKVFFSLNTKGISNKAIKLIPKFYHVDSNGNLTSVNAYIMNNQLGKYEKISEGMMVGERLSSLNAHLDERSTEFRTEKLEAKTLYSGVVNYNNERVSMGTYGKILLGAEYKVPYKAYLESDDAEFLRNVGATTSKKNEILKSVSHWYGDYTLPGDSKFAAMTVTSPSKSDFEKYEKGYILVMFDIDSLDSTNNDYLAYTKEIWEEEGISENVEFHKISKSANPPVKNIKDLINQDLGPVIIYQADKSISQMYDTVGTH